MLRIFLSVPLRHRGDGQAERVFRKWFIRLFGVSLLSLAALAEAQAQSSQLTVDVSGLRNYKGRVVLFLWPAGDETGKFPDPSKVQFRDERGNEQPCDFTKYRVCRRTIESLQNLTVTYTFNGVPPGEYAVFVFHDENNNGIPDTGFLGRPLEARGYSQILPDDINPIAARISFERAHFTLAESKSIVIGLRYPPRW